LRVSISSKSLSAYLASLRASSIARIPVRLFPLVDVAELMHRWPVEAFAAAIDERTRPVYVELIMHMDLSMVDNGHEGALRGVWFVLPVQQAPSTQPRSSAGAAGPQHVSHTRACKFVFTKPLRQRMRAADSGPTWAADRGARAQTAAPRALQRAHRGRSRQTAAADRGSRRRAHTKCTLVPASAPAHAQQPPAHHDPHAVHAGAGMRTRVRRSFALAHTHDPQVHMGRRSACTCTADAHMRRTGPRTRRTEHGQARTRTAYGARTADSAPKRAADRVPTQIVRAQDCAPVPTRAVDVRRSGQCTPRGQGVHVRGGQRVHARGGQRMARRAQRTARTAYSAPTRAATDVPTYGTPMVDGAARACTRTADRGTRTGAADMARTGAADSAPTGACPRAWRTARRSTYWMPTKLRPGIALTMAWQKWPDKATTHQLVVENWPVALKKYCPGPSWSFTQIKNTGRDDVTINNRGHDEEPAGGSEDTDNDNDGEGRAAMSKKAMKGRSGKAKKGRNENEKVTAAFRDMHDALERVYQGEQDPSAPRVRPWTEEEIARDDPLSIPVVVCADHSVLVRAGASESYVKRLQKEAEAAEEADSEDPEDAEDGTGKGSSKAVEHNEDNVSVGQKCPADTQSSGAASKRRHIEQDSEDENNTTLTAMICWYSTVDGGHYSGEFRAIGFEHIPGEMSTMDRYTWYRPARANSTWRQIPYSRPIVTDREASILAFLQEDVGFS
ncbi:hypothetical protein GGX14DRAFT_656859, partial [Mycena pura]